MELTIPYKEYLYEPDNYLIKIAETVCEAGIILDDQLNIVYLSKKAFPNLDSSTQRKALIGKNIKNYDRQSPFEKVLESGKAQKGFLLKNGIDKTNISHIFPIRCNGQIAGLLSVLIFDDLNELLHILTTSHGDESSELSKNIYSRISQTESKYTFKNYIGNSLLIRQVIDIGQKAAKTDYPVLITGETGTGKEIIAHSLHAASWPMGRRPFVRINCTAIPAALLESELFGHEKGAFTGATAAKEGKFQQAGNGTILLDEIEAMDISLQGKLLRVLEEKEFERVGGHRLIPLNARIIASTNQKLGDLCTAGKFRTDLYYRLNIIEIRLPALREHPEDIPDLVHYFCEKNNFNFSLDSSAIKTLMHYRWPGNVRELRNLMIKLSIMYPGETVSSQSVETLLDISEKNCDGDLMPSGNEIQHYSQDINQHEDIQKDFSSNKAHLQYVLDHFNGNIKYAADALHMSRPTLYKKIQQFGLVVRRPGKS